MNAVLEIDGLTVRFAGEAALSSVSLSLRPGRITAVLGANGAGKTTLIRAVMGLDPCDEGTVRVAGTDVGGLSAERRARLGIGYCPEGRRVFPGMTVRENLEVASTEPASARRARLADVAALFPALGARADVQAWTLSGGQQQMLAIGRALMGRPRLLLLDEPSLGLAPALTRQLFATVRRIADGGTAILLAEQNAAQALEHSDEALVLQLGRVVAAGPSAELAASPAVRDAFLGRG